ncbi:hypothetical protein KUV57_13645 [Epibacterium sp. DP7N7-1]|nr:hypothetical protein [Epibacterium sp. DP7N7-1]
MLDFPSATSGLSLFLSAIGQNTDAHIEAIAAHIKEEPAKLKAWLNGEEINEVSRIKLALVLNMPSWLMKPDFEEVALSCEGCRIPSNHIYVGSGSDLDGYWGNLGFKVPGCENSIWMSCSDSMAERFYSMIMNEEHEAVCFAGQGLYSYLVVPHHMKAMRALPEAADSVEGDWEIDDLDPVEGLSVGFTSLLADTFQEFIDLDGLPKEMARDIQDFCDALGGEEKIFEAIRQITVFYKDGTSERFSIDTNDELFSENLHKFMIAAAYADLLDDEDEMPKSIQFRDDMGPVVIPLNSVALVRFPSTYTDARRLLTGE